MSCYSLSHNGCVDPEAVDLDSEYLGDDLLVRHGTPLLGSLPALWLDSISSPSMRGFILLTSAGCALCFLVPFWFVYSWTISFLPFFWLVLRYFFFELELVRYSFLCLCFAYFDFRNLGTPCPPCVWHYPDCQCSCAVLLVEGAITISFNAFISVNIVL